MCFRRNNLNFIEFSQIDTQTATLKYLEQPPSLFDGGILTRVLTQEFSTTALMRVTRYLWKKPTPNLLGFQNFSLLKETYTGWSVVHSEYLSIHHQFMACFYTSGSVECYWDIMLLCMLRLNLFGRIPVQLQWFTGTMPCHFNQGLQIYALNEGTSSFTASQTHKYACTDVSLLHCCLLNLHLRSASLFPTILVLIPISRFSQPIRLHWPLRVFCGIPRTRWMSLWRD